MKEFLKIRLNYFGKVAILLMKIKKLIIEYYIKKKSILAFKI